MQCHTQKRQHFSNGLHENSIFSLFNVRTHPTFRIRAYQPGCGLEWLVTVGNWKFQHQQNDIVWLIIVFILLLKTQRCAFFLLLLAFFFSLLKAVPTPKCEYSPKFKGALLLLLFLILKNRKGTLNLSNAISEYNNSESC